MSSANLDRVREDLAVMRQALGKRLPYGPRQVWEMLVFAAVGAVIAALTGLTGIAALPVERGSPRHLAYIAVLGAPLALLFTLGAILAFRRKAADPLPWREMRQGLVIVAIGVPIVVGYFAWSVMQGLSISSVVIACVFISGFYWLTAAILDPNYRHLWGWALCTLVLALVMPLGSYETAGVFAGSWICSSGLLTAGSMAWQLRRQRQCEEQHVLD